MTLENIYSLGFIHQSFKYVIAEIIGAVHVEYMLTPCYYGTLQLYRNLRKTAILRKPLLRER